MKVRSLAPLATSVVSWEGPDPTVTVVLGATFRLAQAALVLEHRPFPVDDERPGPVSPELWRTSDEVPWKSRPEVLVVGHAFSPTPSHAIPVRLQLGSVDKRCFAVTGAPCHHVPLSSTYLRTAPRGGEVVRVGPVLQHHVAWAKRRLEADVDFADFNAAPPDQRLGFLAPGTSLVLEGTSAGKGQYRAEIPHVYPVAFIAQPGSHPATWEPLPLICDTLWIDADGGHAVLVWRGSRPAPTGDVELVVGAGNRPLQAEELAAPAPPAPPPRNESSHPQTAMLDVSDLSESALPFDLGTAAAAPAPAAPTLPRGDFRRMTLGVDMEGLGLGDILPFGDDAPPAPMAPPAPSEAPPPPVSHAVIEDEETAGIFDEETAGLEELQVETATPFVADGRPPPPPASSRDAGRDTADMEWDSTDGELPFDPRAPSQIAPPTGATEASSVGRETMAFAVSDLSGMAGVELPFGKPASPAPAAASPAPPVVRPPNPAGSVPPPVAPPSVPKPSPTVDPAAPPSAKPLPSLPLGAHAKVRLALLDGEPLEAALAEAEVDEVTWRLADRKLAIDLAREAADGRNALAVGLETAMAEARRAPEAPTDDDEERHDFESYVAIRVELEESDEPAATLRDLGVTTEAWDAMRRRWRRRAIADRTVADRIREALTEARRQLRAERG